MVPIIRIHRPHGFLGVRSAHERQVGVVAVVEPGVEGELRGGVVPIEAAVGVLQVEEGGLGGEVGFGGRREDGLGGAGGRGFLRLLLFERFAGLFERRLLLAFLIVLEREGW